MVACIRDSRYGYCYGYVVDIKINIQEPLRFISLSALKFLIEIVIAKTIACLIEDLYVCGVHIQICTIIYV